MCSKTKDVLITEKEKSEEIMKMCDWLRLLEKENKTGGKNICSSHHKLGLNKKLKMNFIF